MPKERMILAIPERPPPGGRMIHGMPHLTPGFFKRIAASYDPLYRKAPIISGYSPLDGPRPGTSHQGGMTLPPLGWIESLHAEDGGERLTADFSEVRGRVREWIGNGFEKRSIAFSKANPELPGKPPYLFHLALSAGEIEGIPNMPPLTDLLTESGFDGGRVCSIRDSGGPLELRTVQIAGRGIDLGFSRFYSPENRRGENGMMTFEKVIDRLDELIIEGRVLPKAREGQIVELKAMSPEDREARLVNLAAIAPDSGSPDKDSLTLGERILVAITGVGQRLTGDDDPGKNAIPDAKNPADDGAVPKEWRTLIKGLTDQMDTANKRAGEESEALKEVRALTAAQADRELVARVSALVPARLRQTDEASELLMLRALPVETRNTRLEELEARETLLHPSLRTSRIPITVQEDGKSVDVGHLDVGAYEEMGFRISPTAARDYARIQSQVMSRIRASGTDTPEARVAAFDELSRGGAWSGPGVLESGGIADLMSLDVSGNSVQMRGANGSILHDLSGSQFGQRAFVDDVQGVDPVITALVLGFPPTLSLPGELIMPAISVPNFSFQFATHGTEHLRQLDTERAMRAPIEEVPWTVSFSTAKLKRYSLGSLVDEDEIRNAQEPVRVAAVSAFVAREGVRLDLETKRAALLGIAGTYPTSVTLGAGSEWNGASGDSLDDISTGATVIASTGTAIQRNMLSVALLGRSLEAAQNDPQFRAFLTGSGRISPLASQEDLRDYWRVREVIAGDVSVIDDAGAITELWPDMAILFYRGIDQADFDTIRGTRVFSVRFVSRTFGFSATPISMPRHTSILYPWHEHTLPVVTDASAGYAIFNTNKDV